MSANRVGKSTARHHHYISQGYLRGFAKSCFAKKSKITVWDLLKKKTFETNVRNIGGKRDFNRIEIKGFEPDAVESALSTFEDKAIKAIRNVHSQRNFQSNDRDLILEFAAMLSARNPELRKTTAGLIIDANKIILSNLLRTDEEFRRNTIDQIKKIDIRIDENISHNELKDYIFNKLVEIKATNEYYLYAESIMIKTIFQLLLKRKWTLVETSPDVGLFISSDRPVALIYDDLNEIPKMLKDTPGFALPNTAVYFCLSQNYALVGRFDGQEKAVKANQDLVADINSSIIRTCVSQLYSPHLNFHFSCDGSTQSGQELLKKSNHFKRSDGF